MKWIRRIVLLGSVVLVKPVQLQARTVDLGKVGGSHGPAHHHSDKNLSLRMIGQCEVQAGPTVMLPGPCNNLLLTMGSDKDHELSRTRTDRQGRFEFLLEPQNEILWIQSGSPFYTVVLPVMPVRLSGKETSPIGLNIQVQQN